MLTVADGVESAADAAFLQNAGVDCLQGYHFGVPKFLKRSK
jgi:EAL domain-containing protein (putative c-di-GMP-specific phosphodiesterase class I)